MTDKRTETIEASFVREVATGIAEALGYEWDSLPELQANHKNGRIPPKVDFLHAAEDAIARVHVLWS